MPSSRNADSSFLNLSHNSFGLLNENRILFFDSLVSLSNVFNGVDVGHIVCYFHVKFGLHMLYGICSLKHSARLLFFLVVAQKCEITFYLVNTSRAKVNVQQMNINK